ncbi:AraC family transcriptional regulator [uncultured Chitinophaga sp.]|jgi:AraC-type DNA-binding domain-containing proteins|uniref:helix-turn-helix domain-containing protein n=1 Tax=uncultured Chitinophaga sp. TaxID=339340 RepID=UPI0026099CC5|nr:AraC family transcriptional regulator [uncultured Chitinophaga sp.]
MSVQQAHKSQILYSCYYSRNREGEQFIPEHVFSYQVSGSLSLNDGNEVYTFNEGDFRFCRRNQLIKFIKQPVPGGEYANVSVYLDQETLRNFAIEYGYQAAKRQEHCPPVMLLNPDPLYKSYMQSLMPYERLANPANKALLVLKLKEVILILLQANPSLADVLFDFSEPGKIDLEAFMNQHFHFNVELKRFAYLTGRSLATFKRDFEKIFHSSPARWLQKRRLQEAHYLISEKGAAPSSIYLDLGFEDLSHFSFAFKKMYGVSPSKMKV